MNIRKTALVVPLGLFFVFFAASPAADSADTKLPSIRSIAAAFKKAAFTKSEPPVKNRLPERIAEEQNGLVFSAPPRESAKVGMEIYGPVADYLSKVIGKKVVYKYPGTWGVYRTKMLEGSYDIIFDGPHFNSYRMEKLSHNILVKIPEPDEFAVIVRKDQAGIKNIQQMAGYTFCTHAPPNLGTLVLLSQFDNPARQPMIINTKGWDHIYQGVISGKCAGGVMPVALLRQYDRTGETRVVSIAIYDHVESLDYASAHQMSIVLVVFACGLLTVSFVATGSILAPIIGHVAMHVAGIAHGVELPPHHLQKGSLVAST